MSFASPQPLQQTPAFAAALRDIGIQVQREFPIIVQRKFIVFGTVGFATRITGGIDYLRDLRRDGLRILNGERAQPDIYRAAGFHQIITPAHTAEWDLQDTNAGRRAALHPKWRNQLRRAEASNLRLHETQWRGRAHHPLFDHADRQARERRYRPLPHTLITAFAQHAPEAPLIFEAYDKGHLIAAILILRHGRVATYQTAWTSAQGRTCHAHNLLLVHAANRLAALGHKTFDLGLVETQLGASLARFKLRTGATVRQLGGTWIALSGR